MRRSLESRRRAIVRALTDSADRNDDVALTDTVADLVVQGDRLSHHVDEMRTGAVVPAGLPAARRRARGTRHPTLTPLSRNDLLTGAADYSLDTLAVTTSAAGAVGSGGAL